MKLINLFTLICICTFSYSQTYTTTLSGVNAQRCVIDQDTQITRIVQLPVPIEKDDNGRIFAILTEGIIYTLKSESEAKVIMPRVTVKRDSLGRVIDFSIDNQAQTESIKGSQSFVLRRNGNLYYYEKIKD